MKLTEDEERQRQWAVRHNTDVVVPRLVPILKDSTVTRDELCRMLTAMLFRIKDGNEAETREDLYRMLLWLEASKQVRL